jgi:hypothetical protein
MNQLAVLIFRDGNQVCALFGDNLQDGTAGFGNNTAEALRDLAVQIEDEGIVDELDSQL